MPDMFIEAPSPVLLQHSCLCACVSHPALENSAVLFFPSSLQFCLPHLLAKQELAATVARTEGSHPMLHPTCTCPATAPPAPATPGAPPCSAGRCFSTAGTDSSRAGASRVALLLPCLPPSATASPPAAALPNICLILKYSTCGGVAVAGGNAAGVQSCCNAWV